MNNFRNHNVFNLLDLIKVIKDTIFQNNKLTTKDMALPIIPYFGVKIILKIIFNNVANNNIN